MSYDIYLCDPVTKKTLEVDTPHFVRGGTYAAYGTKELWLNVTYNYGRWYRRDGVFPFANENGMRKGIRSIYGMSGAESIPVLKQAIALLENCTDDTSDEDRRKLEEYGATGYWLPTRENAIKPLYSLLSFAQMRPDGIWDGD